MKANSPTVKELKRKVIAADDEFDFVQTCHEVWKPTVYDNELHQRLGLSRASNTFVIVRLALRREMLLGLLRLWDWDEKKRTVDMQWIADTLDKDDRQIVNVLATEYAKLWDDPSDMDFAQSQADKLRQAADEAISIIRKYEKDGSDHSFLQKLKVLRNERLAHRNAESKSPKRIKAASFSDMEVEKFYQDMAKLIRRLDFVVRQAGYNPDNSAEIHAKNAAYFWASVRGERTEGHPDFPVTNV